MGSPGLVPDRQDQVFKFLVIGDYGVGKTAIVRRYTDGQFSSNYKITVGADFRSRSLMWDGKTRLNLQFWDVAGHERFGHMTGIYYKHAIGCAVVFDVMRYKSFQSVTRWVTDLNNKEILDDGSPVPVVLFANKWDVGGSCVPDEAINKLCKELRIRAWFKTSAKDNINIDEGISRLVEEAIKIKRAKETSNTDNRQETHDSLILKEGTYERKDSCCT